MISDFKFINVGSGSKGNASFILYKDTLIQIDMGLSLTRIKNALQILNKTVDDIDFVLITHNHSDHVKTLGLYKDRIVALASKNTLDYGNTADILPFKDLKLKNIEVHTLKTSHDAIGSLGFLFTLGTIKFVYITDTGVLPPKTFKLIRNCDYYVFESNHDVEMLENSSRPEILKSRILSCRGHLSNKQSAQYLSKLVGDKTKAVFLAHLSEECNCEDLALKEHQETYDVSKIKLVCLKQNEETVL